MSEWALFGGAGFIGQHLAMSLLRRSAEDRIHIMDIKQKNAISWIRPLEEYLESGRLLINICDVRDANSFKTQFSVFDVIVNLAAIHREPGHRPNEYFDTNVTGAKNICAFADDIGCKEIIFTSSISVYGVHNCPADEDSVAKPRTPYGQSKYMAEDIHRKWAARTGGRLSIIRPGVVFGPGEGGNVTRLVKEMLKRDRIIRIIPDQAKAGIYIEELLALIHWLRKQPLANSKSQLVNGVSKELLTFNSYGRTLRQMGMLKNRPVVVPRAMLKGVTSFLTPFKGLFPSGSKFHPQRLNKLTLANEILPKRLNEMKYPFQWQLERALADWLSKGV